MIKKMDEFIFGGNKLMLGITRVEFAIMMTSIIINRVYYTLYF